MGQPDPLEGASRSRGHRALDGEMHDQCRDQRHGKDQSHDEEPITKCRAVRLDDDGLRQKLRGCRHRLLVW